MDSGLAWGTPDSSWTIDQCVTELGHPGTMIETQRGRMAGCSQPFRRETRVKTSREAEYLCGRLPCLPSHWG